MGCCRTISHVYLTFCCLIIGHCFSFRLRCCLRQLWKNIHMHSFLRPLQLVDPKRQCEDRIYCRVVLNCIKFAKLRFCVIEYIFELFIFFIKKMHSVAVQFASLELWLLLWHVYSHLCPKSCLYSAACFCAAVCPHISEVRFIHFVAGCQSQFT